jgi:hypothetical protein
MHEDRYRNAACPLKRYVAGIAQGGEADADGLAERSVWLRRYDP